MMKDPSVRDYLVSLSNHGSKKQYEEMGDARGQHEIGGDRKAASQEVGL